MTSYHTLLHIAFHTNSLHAPIKLLYNCYKKFASFDFYTFCMSIKSCGYSGYSLTPSLYSWFLLFLRWRLVINLTHYKFRAKFWKCNPYSSGVNILRERHLNSRRNLAWLKHAALVTYADECGIRTMKNKWITLNELGSKPMLQRALNKICEKIGSWMCICWRPFIFLFRVNSPK